MTIRVVCLRRSHQLLNFKIGNTKMLKNVINTKAALTVALLSLSTAVYSGTVSHTAIIDAYDAAYTTGGVIIVSDKSDHTVLTTLQLPYDPVKLCDTFGDMVDDIVFTKPDYSVIHLDCSL